MSNMFRSKTELQSILGSTALVVAVLAVASLGVQLRGTFPVLGLELIIFVASLLCLVKAADLFTDLAMKLGAWLNISQLGTGVLIIAIGTSAPELFSSIGAALKQQPETRGLQLRSRTCFITRRPGANSCELIQRNIGRF